VLSKTGGRLLKYRRHYPAQATPFAKTREVRS
jgi:type IV secretion system protein VirB3